ncbi:MAG: molybdenum cofactor guanylyltransferase [Gammaproteobacteria bacterium]|jgi:molybdenum cofactor guanylyltransferase
MSGRLSWYTSLSLLYLKIMTISVQNITAVVLAGGRGQRMGGIDKGLIELNSKPLIEYLLDSLKQQQVKTMINANRNLERYQEFNVPVFGDEHADFQGPLAGFYAAMNQIDTDFIVTLPCDGPFIHCEYISRFVDTYNSCQASVLVSKDSERLQPVHALIKTDLKDNLVSFMESGERKIDRWYAQNNFETVDFSDNTDMFLNINRPDDLDVIKSRV